MKIRRFRNADAESVSQLIGTTMRESNAADYPIERLQRLIDYFSSERVRQLAAERYCLVVEEEGLIVATGALDRSEVATFFVLPTHQRRGIGTQLLHALENHARDKGISALTLDASVTGSSFYERHGYQRTGRVVDGTAGPQISLSKSLMRAASNEEL